MTEVLDQLMYDQMHVDTRLLLGDSIPNPTIIDMEAAIDLINGVSTDPVLVSRNVLKYLMCIKNLYVTAKRDFELAKQRKDDIYTDLYQLYGKQDSSNPFFKTAKLTGAFIETAIKENPEYKKEVDNVIKLDSLVTRLFHVKDVLENILDLVKILIQHSDQIPVSGVVLDPEKVKEDVNKFRSALGEKEDSFF